MTDQNGADSSPTLPPSTRAQWLSAVAAIASAIAAIGSLGVAVSSWQTNRDGQRRQLQPYVSVLSATLIQQGDNSAAIHVVFENSGNTPALNLATECYTVVTEGDTITDNDFAKQGTLRPETGKLAPHHQGSCLVGIRGMPGWKMSDLAQGRLTVGVRTYISFDDEFDQKHKLVFTASTGGRAGLAQDGRLSVVGSNDDYVAR
jgi:hypothetical protein